MLSPKNLNVLINLKFELLSRESVSEKGTEGEGTEGEGGEAVAARKDTPRPSTKKLRPQQVNAFQRGCQRREFWAPVH